MGVCLQAPDWRYQTAQAFLHSKEQGKQLSTPSDPSIHYTMRLIRSYKDQDKRIFLQAKQPALLDMFQLGAQNKDTPIRCQLDALILTCDTDEQILDKMKWLDPLALKYYRSVFFDIQEHRKDKSWLEQYIMQPVRHKSTIRLYRSRKLAVEKGYNSASKMFIWGAGTRDVNYEVHALYANEQLKNMFDYVAAPPQVSDEIQAPLLAAALQRSQDRSLTYELRSAETTDSSTIAQLASGLENSIRTYSSQQCQARKDQTEDDAMDTIKTIIADCKAADKDN